ncbi:MAG: pyridoxamine 5'-phosphate oxidase family protein [Candidatus Bathyarchaeota archaeon]|nr:MAG: pyridoxamine 5'-phosphate oxidase family protein [Candidatus Bathyarchaeota archaeon]
MKASEKQKMIGIMKDNCLHAYLGTCDADQPVVRPVSPIVEDDASVWVATFCSSRKVNQIRKNPKICLAFVEQPRGDKAAVVFGEALIIPDLEEKKRIWNLASFDLSQYFPEGPESKEYCLLKIKIEKIEWREGWEEGTKVYKPS